MDKKMLSELDAFAQKLIREAGKTIDRGAKLEVDTKLNRKDLVTNMDKEIQNLVIQRIIEKYHDHKILGEEEQEDKARDMNGYVWILDPIDGTQNFIFYQRDYAVSLALFIDNVGVLGYVYDVVRDELYSAVNGEGAFVNGEPMVPLSEGLDIDNSVFVTDHIALEKYPIARECSERAISVRMLGCCALEAIYVIGGRFSCYINSGCSAWDIAGAVVIGNELGVKLTHVDGSEYSMLEDHVDLIVARPDVHKELLSIHNSQKS